MRAHFFVKLISPRPTFPGDITPEEAGIMQLHAAYWANLMRDGRVHVFGPVMDPDGVYGMGVVNGESSDDVRDLISHDPAVKLMTFTVSPMQATLPS